MRVACVVDDLSQQHIPAGIVRDPGFRLHRLIEHLADPGGERQWAGSGVASLLAVPVLRRTLYTCGWGSHAERGEHVRRPPITRTGVFSVRRRIMYSM